MNASIIRIDGCKHFVRNKTMRKLLRLRYNLKYSVKINVAFGGNNEFITRKEYTDAHSATLAEYEYKNHFNAVHAGSSSSNPAIYQKKYVRIWGFMYPKGWAGARLASFRSSE